MSIEFVSVKGRVYTQDSVLPLVLRMLSRRYRAPLLLPGWRKAVAATLMDPEWARIRNGMCPIGVVNEIEIVAICHGRKETTCTTALAAATTTPRSARRPD